MGNGDCGMGKGDCKRIGQRTDSKALKDGQFVQHRAMRYALRPAPGALY